MRPRLIHVPATHHHTYLPLAFHALSPNPTRVEHALTPRVLLHCDLPRLLGLPLRRLLLLGPLGRRGRGWRRRGRAAGLLLLLPLLPLLLLPLLLRLLLQLLLL